MRMQAYYDLAQTRLRLERAREAPASTAHMADTSAAR